MPLSAEQKIVLKTSGTRVKFEQENPKTPGSKGMTSINQATPLAKLRSKEQIGKTSRLILKKDG